MALGSAAKARVVESLSRLGPLALAELTRSAGLSKSAIRAAAASLAAAGVLRRGDDGRFALTAAGEVLASALRDLDGADRAEGGDACEDRRGQWVALDADGRIIAGDADPHRLVVTLRAEGLHAAGVMRIPAAGEPAPV